MEKQQLAQITTDPKVLDEFSKYENWLVRWRVAKNLNTTPETLDYLSRDKHWGVRYWVARNFNTLSETLKQMSVVEEDIDVKYLIKIHPNCSEETWKYLSALEILRTLPQVST